jgi:hypothetical protein
LFAALTNAWNDGMLEKWNDGMAPFGQINACGEKKIPSRLVDPSDLLDLFAEGVLKSHEVRNFRFSFFIFHF